MPGPATDRALCFLRKLRTSIFELHSPSTESAKIAVIVGPQGSGLLSNGFSRKLENHAAKTALNYFAYNFIKIHRSLRMSPAMAAGVETRLWSVEDLVTLWESYEKAERRAA